MCPLDHRHRRAYDNCNSNASNIIIKNWNNMRLVVRYSYKHLKMTIYTIISGRQYTYIELFHANNCEYTICHWLSFHSRIFADISRFETSSSHRWWYIVSSCTSPSGIGWWSTLVTNWTWSLTFRNSFYWYLLLDRDYGIGRNQGCEASSAIPLYIIVSGDKVSKDTSRWNKVASSIC